MTISAGIQPVPVHIELKRVQTWLFAVPHLRAMIGANALLGETLRVCLPKLARDTGRGWRLAPSDEPYPTADPGDPLSEHDEPAADAKDGIFARDGGHFEAQFAEGAEAFAKAASVLLRERLPGLPFRISINRQPWDRSEAHLSTELPVLMRCAWSGRGLASLPVKQGDEYPIVSLDAAERHKAAKRVQKGTAHDVATLLSRRTNLSEPPLELQDLVGGGYLALLHADGNNVGRALRSDAPRAERAKFFHRNRVLLRKALKVAIDKHCPATATAPLIPLMLGGDDLLLVCRAEVALPFVATLCEELEELQRGDRNEFKLTLGIGVVFAQHTIPTYRLHQATEALVSSAKRRVRGLAEPRSVVDWAVYRASWVDDPIEVRRRDWLRGSGKNFRILSQRPLDVLGEGLDSLQGLLCAAEKLEHVPRSQLHYLVEQLPRGRVLSELAFGELPPRVKGAFREAGIVEGGDGTAGGEKLWRRIANGPLVTPLLDLFEIVEIPRLGRAEKRTRNEGEAARVQEA